MALQSNNLNIKNHLEAIKEHGLGPADPLKPSTEFWDAKAKIWKISSGDARGRLCNNCEYYFDTELIRNCIEDGPAMQIKASKLPLNPKWADVEDHPIGYCEKWDITCSPIRTCDAQEIYERDDEPVEEDITTEPNPILEYSDLTKSTLEDTIK
jgi:hypothetical protein